MITVPLADHPLVTLIPARLARGAHRPAELYEALEWFGYPESEYKEVVSHLIHSGIMELTPNRQLRLTPTSKGTWYMSGAAFEAIREFVLYTVRERNQPPSMRDLWETFIKALSREGALDAISVTWQLLADRVFAFDEHRHLIMGASPCITDRNAVAHVTKGSSYTSSPVAKTNPVLTS